VFGRIVPRRKPIFLYPIPPAPRTAVLAPCFRSCGSIAVFPGGWSQEVEKFAPEALAATLAQLDPLARARIPTPLRHALIVLGKEGGEWLTDADRERLWDAFRVPVFEQIIGDDGQLLAAECEAHEGLHIESSHMRAGGRIVVSPCACGRKTPRLFHGAPSEELVMHAHAYGH
jgi:hypothetical protein